MAVGVTRSTTVTIRGISARGLAETKLADSCADAIDITGTIWWLNADTADEVTRLGTRTITALAWICAAPTNADSPFEAVALNPAGVRLWAAPIDTGAIARTFEVIRAWILALAALTDAVADAVHISGTALGLYTTAGIVITDLTTGAVVITVTGVYTDLIVSTDASRVTVFIDETEGALSTVPVFATDPWPGTIEVIDTRRLAGACLAHPLLETVFIGGTDVRLLTEPTRGVTVLGARATRCEAAVHAPTRPDITDLSVCTII